MQKSLADEQLPQNVSTRQKERAAGSPLWIWLGNRGCTTSVLEWRNHDTPRRVAGTGVYPSIYPRAKP